MRLIDYRNPDSLAYRFRKKRIEWLVELVRHTVSANSLREISICDIGGTKTYWNSFPFDEFQELSFRIDLYNITYPDYDHDCQLASNVIVNKLVGDACDMSDIPAKTYHISHSNSVIEHVGDGRAVEKMANELQRVSLVYFIQTPNFWFPIEPHFLIPFYALFPRPVRIWLLIKFKCAGDLNAAIHQDDFVRLLTRKEMQSLFPGGEMLIEKFIGFPKSIVVRSRIST